MWVNRLTHTVTHTTKCVERFKEHRRGGFCLLSGIFASFFCLHDLCHETAHRLCGLVLLLPCSVGVGAESESGVIVAEHTADGFDVHAILQCQRCEGMSEIMKADMLQSRVLSPVLLDGNIHGLFGCLACSCFNSSTASCGMDTSRMEFPVLGWLRMRFPSVSQLACLLTEMVQLASSRSLHWSATSSPFRNPLTSSR